MSLYFVLATDCHLKSSQSKIAFISDTLFYSLRTNDKQDNKPNYWDQWCDIHSIKIIKIYLKYFGFLLTRLLIKDDGSFPALFAFFDLRDVLMFLKNNQKPHL